MLLNQQREKQEIIHINLHQGLSNGTWNPQMGHGVLDAYAAVQDVTVSNNAKLILDAPGAVIINGLFEVQVGTALDIK